MRWINRRPGPVLATVLAALPFLAVLAIYMIGSDMRLAVNPSDKLLPAPTTILSTAERLLTEPDRRSGEILFWLDTWASLRRLFIGVMIASSLALVMGILIGMLPYMRAPFAPFVAVFSMVPPLAVLPILFIMLGLGEVSKVALIVIGISPFLIRDMSQRVIDLPREQFIKAQTLGASSMAIGLHVILPQVLPRLIGAVRLSLGPAWLFLIAAEAIAADQGLGYRIFLVRRYLAMDVILTYVVWITFLAYLLDFALRQISKRAFPWDGESL
ncbi:ABC transporter permease subunit [Mameliella sp. CS4]|uniref:ABC transporter permease n=1 Tax=Mameliella sp. CS4 TaxID=2862329 RepID=UPI001C5E569D|nr:ABC transporter permease subunit [Mameliella sp. CS4]MBW4983930.1 ABC transporter permease subunit [Mameliella sp. CS4]